MKKRGLAKRIVAIFLCALMVLSVFAVALTRVFAADENISAEAVNTGSSSIWIVLVAVIAVAAIVIIALAVTSKKKKK
jgi:surface glycoprotein (TIGR04207 family)/LPXTG-motif cell wall-anchored protein